MDFLKYLARVIFEAVVLGLVVGIVLAYILTQVLHFG